MKDFDEENYYKNILKWNGEQIEMYKLLHQLWKVNSLTNDEFEQVVRKFLKELENFPY